MKKLQVVYGTVLFLAIIFVAYMYGINFNSMSETELVNLSLIWVPCVVFGVSGLLTVKKAKPLIHAIMYTIGSIFLLAFFFMEIWPLL